MWLKRERKVEIERLQGWEIEVSVERKEVEQYISLRETNDEIW